MTTTWKSAAVGPVANGGSSAATAQSADATVSAAGPAAATVNTDFAAAMNTASTGYVALMGGTVSYNNSTGAVTGTIGTSGGSVTLSQSNGNALLALLNTTGVAAVAAKAANAKIDAPTKTVLIGYDTSLTNNQVKSALRELIVNQGT